MCPRASFHFKRYPFLSFLDLRRRVSGRSLRRPHPTGNVQLVGTNYFDVKLRFPLQQLSLIPFLGKRPIPLAYIQPVAYTLGLTDRALEDCVREGILLSCAKVTKGISAGGWGQVAHGLRTVIGCCEDWRRRRRRWTDLSRDLSNEQNGTRTMPLSRNQSKSAENFRCQRNLLMYFQCAQILNRENY